MLAGGQDRLYREALASGFEPYVRVEIWDGTFPGNIVVEDMPISNGEVTATLSSRVSRVATVLAPGAMYDVVSPFGHFMRAYRGIRFGEGDTTYVWQVFGGHVTDTELTAEGFCAINAADRADDVVNRTFTVPENSTVGSLVTDEWQRLITDAVPHALFGASDPFSMRIPALTWEHDRAGALDEMATALGAFWYPLANERFVIRRVPWTVRAEPILTLADGDGGLVTSSAARRDRANVFNQVTVTGERLDGTRPVYATVSDEDPTSPTYFLGPFGIQNRLLTLNTPSNQEAARTAAQDYLRRSTALTEAWSCSMVPDASIELGDTYSLSVQGRMIERQVVQSLSIPLVVQASMNVAFRAQVVGGLADAA